jgi:hypothetical protein
MARSLYNRSMTTSILLLLALNVLGALCAGPIPLIQPDTSAKRARIFSTRREDDTSTTTISALSSCLYEAEIEFIDSAQNDTATYYEASQSDNLRFHFHPVAVAYPKGVKQVAKAVKCAAISGNVQVAARSGGHSFAGFGSGGQDGALVLDLKYLNQTRTDSANQLAHIGPATRLGDVVKVLWADGQRGMPHGTCPTVGTGGHALCGGFGPTSRKWGLAADNIVEAEVVLADGSIVHASQHENAELWWALRGSGSFFGIVTQFTFSTFDASSPMTFLEYRWTRSLKSVDDAVKLMQGVQAFATEGKMPAELGWHIQAQLPHDNDPAGGVIAIHMRGMYAGNLEKYKASVIPPLWKELKKRRAASQPDAVVEHEISYLQMMEEWDDFGKPGDKLDTLAERLLHNNFIARTSLSMGQRGISAKGFKAILSLFWDRAVVEAYNKANNIEERFFMWNIYFEMFGGTNARHRQADLLAKSSMVYRDALWLIQGSVSTWVNGDMPHTGHLFMEKIDSTIDSALKKDRIKRKSYSCYADITLENWKDLYYGSALPRLVALKKQLDPTNLFRNPQSLIDTPTVSNAGNGDLVLQDKGYSNVHPLN